MWKDLKKKIPDVDKDELLELIGLESRRSAAERMVPALAIFGAGVLVGVGLGLMLAPRPGRELRGQLKDRLGKSGNGSADEKPVTAAPPPRAV